MSIRKNFPLLARHEGVWEGYYRYYDVAGETCFAEFRSPIPITRPTCIDGRMAKPRRAIFPVELREKNSFSIPRLPAGRPLFHWMNSTAP